MQTSLRTSALKMIIFVFTRKCTPNFVILITTQVFLVN